MAKHIHIHPPTKFTVAKTKTKDQDYKRDAAGKFAEGDRVKADANYGGKAGHVESSIGHFHVVKHDDGSKASYHESNLKPHEDEDEDDGDETRDAGFDESKHKRDHGKFATTSGDAAHHDKQAVHHAQQAKQKGMSHPDYASHFKASEHHAEAATQLRKAADYKAKGAKANGIDLAEVASDGAEASARKAKQHEQAVTVSPEQAAVPMVKRPVAPKAAKPAAADITKHPQYTKEDHDYLKGKGWSDQEISKRWDEEHAGGQPPQQVNKYNAPAVRYDHANRPIK